ncbi:MAG: TetR/AcrR family transcriptional regulator [Cohaesibacteraceae bacterium]|nr:TetR/AcrR family transcriptional regulator [Cohaesibacteraceae bacterium]
MAKELTQDQIVEKRASLIAHAITILDSEGPDALTLRRLAVEAGVSRSTPYLYFKDKAALKDAMQVEGFIMLTSAYKKALEGLTHNRMRMKSLGDTYVAFALAHPELYELIFLTKSRRAPMSDKLAKVVDAYCVLTEEPMQAAWDAGELSMEPERLNKVLWVSLHGLLSLNRAGVIGGQSDFEALRADLGKILCFGFLPDEGRQELKTIYAPDLD